MSDRPEDDADHAVPVVGTVIGLAQDALTGLGEVVPRLVDRSRRQFDFALAVVERLRCGSSSERDGTSSDGAGTAGDGGGGTTSHGSTNGAVPAPEPSTPPELTIVPDPGPSVPAPAVATLSIPDYDSLAASQVLPRLDGLTGDELEAIRAYEAAHRNRRTILGRLTQLLA